MKRNSIYILLSFCVFSSLTFSNFLNPDQSWIFIIEELVGLIFLVLGFLVFNKVIRKVIVYFNKANPWTENIIRRFFLNIGVITLFSLLISITLLSSGWIFFKVNGAPTFFKEIELAVSAERAQRSLSSHRQPSRSYTIKEFSVFYYTHSIIGGCLFMFTILFFIEESHEYNHIKYQQKISEEQAAKEQALSKVNALQNQLNPHFMFNTLNVLSELMHEDLDKADKFIQKLSEIYRYVIIQSEDVITTVSKEIEFIRAYVYLLKIRFEDQLNITIEVDESRLNWVLPSLTLELLIGNAIKHNSLNTRIPLMIKIVVENDNLMVINNYRPRLAQIKSTGIGIKNLKERLSLLGAKGANFEIYNEKFIATIPLLNPDI